MTGCAPPSTRRAVRSVSSNVVTPFRKSSSVIAHVSCLARQAKEGVTEAEENNLDDKAIDERWKRWYMCGLCEQDYHGVVSCALGWACWKTYVGLPERNFARRAAIDLLGTGLHFSNHLEDALSVREAQMSMLRRLGESGNNILAAQGNLASSYRALGRYEQALSIRQDVYSETLKLNGEESIETLAEANNYASELSKLEHYDEAKSLMRKTMPVARRILGKSHELMLKIQWTYAKALYYPEYCRNDSATLAELREAVETLQETERTARRVLGNLHPLVTAIVRSLRDARAARDARETPSPSGSGV